MACVNAARSTPPHHSPSMSQPHAPAIEPYRYKSEVMLTWFAAVAISISALRHEQTQPETRKRCAARGTR